MDKPTKPVISVIIPIWNGARDIEGALKALSEQSADRASFEVIVVDNGSTDDTVQVIARYPWVTLLSEPEPGSYRARNRGVAAAKGDFLLFTDADCTPARTWIEAALDRASRHPEQALIGGKVILYREAGAGELACKYDEMTGFNQDWNLNVGNWCVTANWLCSKAALAAVGGFDGEVLSGGDVKCSREMHAAGFALIYADEMVVRHPTRASLGAIIRKRRRVVGGRWQANAADTGRRGALAKMLLKENVEHLRWVKGGSYTGAQKVGLAAMVTAVSVANQLELLRLGLGFRPYRS